MSEKRWWICTVCRYMLHEVEAPETCPACRGKCAFIDATCYTPECGGTAYPDPSIVSRSIGASATWKLT